MKRFSLSPKTRWDWAGWLVAGSLASIYLMTGFQGSTDKMAVVDIVKVAEDSNLGKTKQTTFAKQKATREALIEFIDKNRVIAADQIGRLRDLTLKDSPTDAETTELTKLKSDIQAKGKRLSDLQSKPNLTPEERQILDDYSHQSQMTENYVNRWFQEFAAEMQGNYNTQRQAVLDAARATAKTVAKAQACTLVFDSNAAPFGAIDITDATLQAINKSP